MLAFCLVIAGAALIPAPVRATGMPLVSRGAGPALIPRLSVTGSRAVAGRARACRRSEQHRHVGDPGLDLDAERVIAAFEDAEHP